MGLAVAFALFALFLLALAAVAFAAARLFTARDAQGRREPLGCVLGCGLGAALLLLALLGLAAFVAGMATLAGARALEANPVERIRVVSDQEALDGVDGLAPFHHDPRRPLHVVFEVAGGEAPVERLLELVERHADGEASVAVREVRRDGRDLVLVDVALPAGRNDLRELERELRRWLPRASLGDGVVVELRGVHRDW
jgi:hypothetical protein